mgnify:CR=1 FL=1
MGLLEKFTEQNRLKVNTEKTRIMCIGRGGGEGSVMFSGVLL